MMISVWLVLQLAVGHFVGDFLAQTSAMGLRKAKDWYILTRHVTVYSLMLLGVLLVTGEHRGALIGWLGLNAGLHWVTDAITSRITARLWFFSPRPGRWEEAGKGVNAESICDPWVLLPEWRHAFFVMIGCDQLVHMVTLVCTAAWMLR